MQYMWAHCKRGEIGKKEYFGTDHITWCTMSARMCTEWAVKIQTRKRRNEVHPDLKGSGTRHLLGYTKTL